MKCEICGAEYDEKSGKIGLTYKGIICIKHEKACDLCGIEKPLIHMIDTGEYQYCGSFCKRMHQQEINSY